MWWGWGWGWGWVGARARVCMCARAQVRVCMYTSAMDSGILPGGWEQSRLIEATFSATATPATSAAWELAETSFIEEVVRRLQTCLRCCTLASCAPGEEEREGSSRRFFSEQLRVPSEHV